MKKMTIEQKKDSLSLNIIPNPHKEKIAQEREKVIKDVISKTQKKVNELSEVSISNLWWCSTVTWSSTLIEVKRKWEWKSNPHSVLIDLWKFQWTWNDIEHNKTLPFDRSKLNAVILTHAHLDHIWRVPMLEKEEFLIRKPSWEIVKSSAPFNWFIYTSHAGKWLTEVMLVDSARVMAKEWTEKMKMVEGKKENLTDMIKQLEDLKKCVKISYWRKWRTNKYIQQLNFKEHIDEQISKIEEERAKYRWINIGNIDRVFKTYSKDIEDKILYTMKEVEAVKSKIKWTGFYKEKAINSLKWQKNPWISFVLHWAEHVFWSAIVSVFVDDGKWWTINLWFSWDLWRLTEPYNLIAPDIPPFEYDTFMIESTYWWRNHPWRLEEKIQIANAMNNVFNRWWKIVVPAFMLQRHQDVSSFILEMQEEWLIPKNIKIYYDWWSIQSINNIYRAHDKDKVYTKLFDSKNFIFVWNNKDPEANEFLKSSAPSVIVAPSGMLKGWTIMQYISVLKYPENACMLFWYQWAWTTGRKLLEASENWMKSIYVPEVTDNKNESWTYLHIVKNVNLFQWKSFTTHWDQHDLLYFLSELKFKPNATILINHWDKDEWQMALAKALKQQSFLREDINVVLTQAGGKLSNVYPFVTWWQYKVNTIIEWSKKPEKNKNIVPINNILTKAEKDEPLKWVFDRDLFRKMWKKISPSGSFILSDKQVDDILFAIYEDKIDKMDLVFQFIAGLIVKSDDEEIQDFLQNPFTKKKEQIKQTQEDILVTEEPHPSEMLDLINKILPKKRKPKEWKNSKNNFKKEEFVIIVKRKWKKIYSAEIFLRSWKNPEKKLNDITWMDMDSLKTQLVNLGYILPHTILMEKWCILIDASKVSAWRFINKAEKDNIVEISIKSSWDFIAGSIYYRGELIKTVRWSTKKVVSRELRKILSIPDDIDLKNRTKWKKIEVVLDEWWLSIVKKILVKNSLQKPENIIEVKIIKWKNRVEGLIYYKWNIIKQVFGSSKTDVSRLLRESSLIPTKTQLIDKDWKIIKITLNESTFPILKELLKNPPVLEDRTQLIDTTSLEKWEHNIKKIIPVSSDNNSYEVWIKTKPGFKWKKNKADEQDQLDKIEIDNIKKKIKLKKSKSNLDTEKLPKKDKSNKLSRKKKIKLWINKKTKKEEEVGNYILKSVPKKTWPRQIDLFLEKQAKKESAIELKRREKNRKRHLKIIEEKAVEKSNSKKAVEYWLSENINNSENIKIVISDKWRKANFIYNEVDIQITASNKDKLLRRIRTTLWVSQKTLISNGTILSNVDPKILKELFK